MRLLFLFSIGFGLAYGGESKYATDVSTWIEEVPPPENTRERTTWFYSANYCPFEWVVFSKDGVVHAVKSDDLRAPDKRNKWRVQDGWLIATNRGEFGADLMWVSTDDKSITHISEHHVVEFIVRGKEILAIEGLSHMGQDSGSLIQINNDSGKWRARELVKLPLAPYAVTRNKNQDLLIALSDAAVLVTKDNKVHSIVDNTGWGAFYPTSCVLSSDECKLFVGMRQFVAEVDLKSKKVRLLIPSQSFLNQLTKEERNSIGN